MNDSDLISRQAVIEVVHKSIFDFFDICDDDKESPMTYKNKLLLELNKAITTQIKAMVSVVPYVEIEPVKHGRWKHHQYGNTAGYYECDNCGKINSYKSNYCPYCGAQMDLDEVKND